MLLPAVPFLAISLASLEAVWHPWARLLGAFSVLSAVAFACAGLVPSNTIPLVYAWKTVATTLGSGLFFGAALPQWLGVETLHTAIAKTGGASVWRRADLAALIGRQAAFSLVQMTILAGAVRWLSGTRFGRGQSDSREI